MSALGIYFFNMLEIERQYDDEVKKRGIGLSIHN